MKTDSEFQECAIKLKALAQSTRLRITQELLSSERSVTQLCHLLGEPMVNVSHHLGVLRQAELVNWEVQGREIVYSLNCVWGSASNSLDLGCCCLNLDAHSL